YWKWMYKYFFYKFFYKNRKEATNDKKIAFVGNSLWSMFNFRKEVIKDYVEKGYKVYVIADINDNKKFLIEGLGANYINTKINKTGINPLREISYFFELYSIYKANKFSTIIHYTVKPIIYG